MAGDYTRLTFDPRLDRAMVLEQQGRVHLDADFNELVSILERRLRVETRDFAGPAVVPASEPDSFKIVTSGGDLAVQQGRIYVDGLLAENHGTGDVVYEPVWNEPGGKAPTKLVDQPYIGDPSQVENLDKGNQLVYLDVWQRELTAVEDPSIVEPALGIDTCTRVQTVWQVRAIGLDDNGRHCSDDWSKDQNWLKVTAPSAARLSSWADQPPQPADPCAVAPVGGYRGTENRLYRVEVHDGGGVNQATIKWSRDNGAVATVIVGPIANPGTKPIVTVQRLGRDDVLRFSQTDWVELLDDTHELDRAPGIMAQVESIDQTQNTITLTAPLAGPIDVNRNPRIRRWDQKQGVSGQGVIAIPAFPTTVALEDGVKVKLDVQDGKIVKTGDWWVFWARAATASVEVLTEAPPRGIKHHYARLGILENGQLTDDCRVVFPGACECEGDCGCTLCVTPQSHADDKGSLTIQDAINQVRRKGGRVCLAPGHYRLRKPLEIQGARGFALSGDGMSTLITYVGSGLGIEVVDSVDVTLERFVLAVAREQPKNWRTRLGKRQETQAPVLTEAWFPNAGVGTEAPLGEQTIGIALVNTADCRVDRCFVLSGFVPGANVGALFVGGSLGIGLGGWALRTRLTENVVLGDVAVGDLTVGRAGITSEVAFTHVGLSPGYFACVDLSIVDNLLLGLNAGVDFGSLPRRPISEVDARERDLALEPTLRLGTTRITGNLVLAARSVGIAVLGTSTGRIYSAETMTGSSGETEARLYTNASTSIAATVLLMGAALTQGLDRLEISDNVLDVMGTGIAASPGALLIVGNDITGATDLATMRGGGILVQGGGFGSPPAVVASNTVRNVGPYGISWSGTHSTVEVRGNELSRIVGCAIEGTTTSQPDVATVCDNRIDTVGPDDSGAAYGIQVQAALTAEVRRNVVTNVGDSADADPAAGILLGGCSLAQVTDNVVQYVGPSGSSGLVFGIAYGGTVDALDVRGNIVDLNPQVQVYERDVAEFAILQVREGSIALHIGEFQETGTQDGVSVTGVRGDMYARVAALINAKSPAVLDPIAERSMRARSFEAVFREGAEFDPVPPGAGDIAVTDNVLRQLSSAQIVWIETTSNVTLTQNRIVREGQGTGQSPVFSWTKGATIVSSNRVELSNDPEAPASMLLFVDPGTELTPHCTILGNITTQQIELNGNPITSPWDTLNVVA